MSTEPVRVTRVAAYALCTDGDGILLCRIAAGWTSDADGRWTLPGGGLDFGENPRTGALRELSEETGLTGKITELAGVASWSKRFTDPEDHVAKDMHGVQIVYRVRVTGGELRDEPAGSTDTCRWVRRAEVASLPIVDLVKIAVPLAFPDAGEGRG